MLFGTTLCKVWYPPCRLWVVGGSGSTVAVVVAVVVVVLI